MSKFLIPFTVGFVCLPSSEKAGWTVNPDWKESNAQRVKVAALTGKPNIIFILSDDLSYKDLSCYGQMMYSTPNLDRLALNGLRFNQAYSGSPESAPSRCSLMTGMHMGHSRIRANESVRGQDHLVDDDVTVAEVLKKAGYVTGFIGKWGIGLPGTEGTPDRQGFDLAYGFYDQARAHGYFPNYLMRNGKAEEIPENYGFNMERVYKHTADTSGEYDNIYDDTGRLMPAGIKDPLKGKYSEDLFEQEALAFIKHNKDKTFFLYYATQLPHGPNIASSLGKFKDKPWDQKHREWAAMIERMDMSVGRIVSMLEELDIISNTVIFFAGDNGYSHWGYFNRKPHEDDPLFKNKGPWPKGKFTSTHEGGMRIPFFVTWPGKIKPGESNHITALYDFLPTAGDFAGAAVPVNDGISLFATLTGRPDQQQEHEYLYWENGTFSTETQSLRLGPWWAFRNSPSEKISLYDIKVDTACLFNVAGNYPEIVARIEQIFRNAHSESEWYVNPGESKEFLESKKKKAIETGTQQKSKRPDAMNNNYL